MLCWFCHVDLVFSNVLLTLYHRGWLHLPKYIPGNLKCSTSWWVMLTLEVESIRRGEWRRKGTCWADSILENKETSSYIPSETLDYVRAMEITYLQPNRPPGLINTRFHTKISHCQKECNNPLCSQSLEKAMAPHSSTLAWKIPWTEEPGRLQSVGSWRVRHDWAISLSLFTFMHWRRKWQPTPVFLPGESQRQRGLVGCRLWGRTEWDMTEVT